MSIRTRLRLANLPQWTNVIKDPERTPMCGSNEIGVLDSQVVNGDDGQIALQRLPVFAIIKRNQYAWFGSGIEQAAARRALPTASASFA